ncbi:MAG: 16S rRNA processing protein RimM [Lachnospiraceae bacterium]|nr:16S rRNA processing protein RimM [Lachnospiraceae bacterium]
MTQEFQVGVIASPHGLKGEVNVFATTDDPKRFLDLDSVTMDNGRGEVLTLNIEGVKFTKKFVIVKFKEFHSIEDVERLRGKKLMIRRDQAIPLAKGEYYVPDLIGLKVYDITTNELFGTLTKVIETGANDVYEVERSDNKGMAYLPKIDACVKEINVEEDFMKVFLMPGLVD